MPDKPGVEFGGFIGFCEGVGGSFPAKSLGAGGSWGPGARLDRHPPVVDPLLVPTTATTPNIMCIGKIGLHAAITTVYAADHATKRRQVGDQTDHEPTR